MPSNKRSGPIRLRLLAEAKHAALNAIQTFNNPLATFKTETFIVLMVIAWRSLLHAYYRSHGVEYRYFDPGPRRRRFRRTKAGAYKHWELERCLNDSLCPLDGPTKRNLRFLIGLRNEIEHHQSAGVDEAFTGRYLACCLNFERVITSLFGDRHSVAPHISYALQLRNLASPSSADEDANLLPRNVESYVSEFDAETLPTNTNIRISHIEWSSSASSPTIHRNQIARSSSSEQIPNSPRRSTRNIGFRRK